MDYFPDPTKTLRHFRGLLLNDDEGRQPASIIPLVILVIVTTFTWATLACAQSTNRRMMPGQSLKDLVAEDPTQEGIVQIKLGQLFKEGPTEYTALDRRTLKDAPPLPTGFIPFRDQAYRVTTKALISGEHIVVFHFPSVNDQAEFKKLEVLYLAEDEMSPFGESWIPVTVTENAWDESTFRFISKVTYERFLRDFSSRRIAATTEDFGVFAIAIAPETSVTPKEPFTRMEVAATSNPEIVRRNEQVSHTFTIKNLGPAKAEEVNFQEELNPVLDFESVVADQGKCRGSNRSSNRVLCHLGPIAAGATVTVRITAHVSKNTIIRRDVEPTTSIAVLNFKQRPTDFVDEKNYLIVETKTAILKGP